MALTVWIGLLTIRWVFQMLGDDDYGVLTAAGSLLAMVPVVAESLTTSGQRHLAWEIGREDSEQLGRVFSTQFVGCLVLSAAAWVVMVSLAPVVLGWLTIPAGRETAAMWVYLLSATTIAGVLAFTPYRSFIMARQWFVSVAVVDVLLKLMTLLMVLVVWRLPVDRLVFYAVGTSSLVLLGSAYWVFVVSTVRGGVRPSPRQYRWQIARELVGFAGWSSLLPLAFQLRVQAPVLVLNLTYGPQVNGAYAIAAQVMMYVAQVPLALVSLVSPAVVTAYARGQRETAERIAMSTAKISSLVLICLALPLLLNAEALLDAWLGRVPAYGAALTAACGFAFLGQTLSSGHLLLMSAAGDLRGAMVRFVLGDLIGLVAGAVVVATGVGGPLALPICLVSGSLLTNVGLVPGYVESRIGFPARKWWGGVVARLLPAVFAAGLALAALSLMPPGLLRLGLAYVLCTLSALVAVAVVGLNRDERAYLAPLLLRLFGRGAHVARASEPVDSTQGGVPRVDP
jgi:O-antigen/teichoic acid export membrane protein